MYRYMYIVHAPTGKDKIVIKLYVKQNFPYLYKSVWNHSTSHFALRTVPTDDWWRDDDI